MRRLYEINCCENICFKLKAEWLYEVILHFKCINSLYGFVLMVSCFCGKACPFLTASDLEYIIVLAGLLLHCEMCVSPSLNWLRKHKQGPFRSHLFQIRRRQCYSGSPWCAAFINKPTARQQTDLVFGCKDRFYNIFTNVVCCPSRPFCWHYKLQAKACQSVML